MRRTSFFMCSRCCWRAVSCCAAPFARKSLPASLSSLPLFWPMIAFFWLVRRNARSSLPAGDCRGVPFGRPCGTVPAVRRREIGPIPLRADL